MREKEWMRWAAAGLSAVLLELPFPLAGPMPPWRGIFAFFGLTPLIWAVMRTAEQPGRPLRRGFLLGYTAGFLWYLGNCYWVRDTMSLYGGMPPLAPTLLLIGFSLVLGLYWGLFGLGLAAVRRGFGVGWALATAPFLWVAQELAAARITSVPWDQLGYSQVDNRFMTVLAPWAGVYGISFVLVALNALYASGGLGIGFGRRKYGKTARFNSGTWPWYVGFTLIVIVLWSGWRLPPHPAPINATAILVQPNLDVGGDLDWNQAGWNEHIAQFAKLASEQCKSYIAGIPQTGAPTGEIPCPSYVTHPDLVAWPEAPAPFEETDPAFQKMVDNLARRVDSTLIVGGIGMDFSEQEQRWRQFNSAMLIDHTGSRIGRYDKIHLVPFGEFVPYENLLFFARKLTGRVSKFDRGTDRKVFRIPDQHGDMRRYGIFICYEAVFADEVRQFARNGAQVLVNISDDGWYGDTSAPWQHLNMARMRAIENRRWLLRDTNNGVTAAIDPYGRVRQSIPRHQADALPAQYGFRDDVTFYTQHGDVFAWCCAILSLGIVLWAFKAPAQS